MSARVPRPLALVLGDIDMVRPLARAGVPCALYAMPGNVARRSRHVCERLPFVDHWGEQEAMTDLLLAFAARQPVPPVLFPQTDGDLLALSRHRERLDGPCRLLLAERDMVATLLDKAAFSTFAQRAELPVPRAVHVRHDGPSTTTGLRFPLVVKPLTRHPERWAPVAARAKALSVEDGERLDAILRDVRDREVDVLVQEAIPGPESAIESYHAYVDAGGMLVAGFTGRKIRTFPTRYGHSTALEVTDEDDVRRAGAGILERIGLRGLAKLDFKRGPDGTLHLLEINPRATLWLNPGAVAGVNLAALVYADLAGEPRPPVGRVRAGVRWCQPTEDVRAARAEGLSMVRWLGFLASCETRSALAWDDPWPFLRGTVLPAVGRRLLRR